MGVFARMKCYLVVISLLIVLTFGLSSDIDRLIENKYKSQLPVTSSENIVQTQYGTLRGAVYETARAFYAIPYAQPPVGSLKYHPPQTPSAWNGTRAATRYGPGCSQICELPPYTCTYAGTDENCLTLDVYTPRLDQITSPAPVLLFIHGGNYIQGGTGTILYNADFISNNTGVIVVNVQYRLGALGFFYNGNVTGNFGILDQTMAMQWVKDNIDAFGGDPSRVTIWGQSAGGSSVACHLISPPSKHLMSAAAMDSNPITLNLNSVKQAEQISSRFAQLLGCDENDLECLRQSSISDILNAQNNAIEIYPLHPLNAFMPWQPMVDGDLIPLQPLDAFANGQYNHVPFISGNVNDEALMFIDSAFPNPVPYSEYLAVIGVIFGPVAPQVLAEYPVPADQMNDTRPTMTTLGTDYIFTCPLRRALRQMANDSVDVYYYHFDHAFTNFDPWGPDYPECVGYVCHGSELPYIFNSAEIGSFYTGYKWSQSEAELAAHISTAWGNFATSGTPNSPKQVSPQWPLYNQDTDQDMKWATPSSVETGYLQSYCDFWDTLGYTWGN